MKSPAYELRLGEMTEEMLKAAVKLMAMSVICIEQSLVAGGSEIVVGFCDNVHYHRWPGRAEGDMEYEFNITLSGGRTVSVVTEKTTVTILKSRT